VNKHPAHASGYVGSAYGGMLGASWGGLGVLIAKDAIKHRGASKAFLRTVGGITGGMSGLAFNFGYSYITTGKWNWCQALIEGAFTGAIGILAA